jgi:hypothetical protein
MRLLVFEAKDVLARVEKRGDLFEPVLTLKQKLPQLSGLDAASETEDEPSSAVRSEEPPSTKAKTKTKATHARTTNPKKTAVAVKRPKL